MNNSPRQLTIRDWPNDERPREKLLHHGAQRLSDAELLAIFLRTGTAGRSAVDLGRELLQTFGGLRELLTAEPGELRKQRGLGDAKACQLIAAVELGRRFLGQGLRRGSPFAGPNEVRTYLVARLRDIPYEVFVCLFLDTRHRVIECEEMFRGTLDGASVHPREVVRAALAKNAAAVIFAHNHPSGVPEPSAADRSLTDRLKSALALVEVRVLDHFVIGDGHAVSFAERGLL